MSAAHRVRRRVRLRLLQDSRQGRLPLLPLSGTRWRLLGSVLEGREASVTAESESEMKSRMHSTREIRWPTRMVVSSESYLKKKVYELFCAFLFSPGNRALPISC